MMAINSRTGVKTIGKCWLFFFASVLTSTGFSQGELSIGDAPPELNIISWLQGDPVATFEKDKIYVIEFSGTWCHPCRKAIPHLNHLSHKYSGRIHLVSIYLENNDRDKPSDLRYVDNVRYLVEAMKGKMDFTIGVDVPQQTTKKAWRLNGVPKAFVIVNSKIVWIGHPVDLEPPIVELLKGSFDAERAQREQQEFYKELNSILESKGSNKIDQALSKMDSLLARYPFKSYLYYHKFRLLAGYKDTEAYNWLKWLLKDDLEGFDWVHFISREFNKIKKEDRDYLLELETIDHVIKLSESKYYETGPWQIKAQTFAEMENYSEAVNAIKKAIECVQSPPGGTESIGAYSDLLIYYQYKDKASRSIVEANRWLTDQLSYLKYYPISMIMDAVVSGPQPDYSLAVMLADQAFKNVSSENPGMKVVYLKKKIEYYVGMKDIANAINCCEQAINMSRTEGLGAVADLETKLSDLKKLKTSVIRQK